MDIFDKIGDLAGKVLSHPYDELIDQVAEVAGYLWQKGWAERNGGNITVNITDKVDDYLRRKTPVSAPISIGLTLPHIKGCWFYCKGTGRRMRDLARAPLKNGSIIRICDDCAHYEIIAEEPNTGGSVYKDSRHCRRLSFFRGIFIVLSFELR